VWEGLCIAPIRVPLPVHNLLHNEVALVAAEFKAFELKEQQEAAEAEAAARREVKARLARALSEAVRR